MDDEFRDWIRKRLDNIDEKVDKIHNQLNQIVPEQKDNSKLLQEIAKLVVKGKSPRKQPIKKCIHGVAKECECFHCKELEEMKDKNE